MLALVGCGTGSSTQASHVEAHVAQRNAAPARVGQHASRIALVAAAEDGTAVVSQDVDGGTRVWPSFDGTREPMIVPVDAARDLAIARTAGGYVILATDEAGGGEIVSTATNGGLVRRNARHRAASGHASGRVSIYRYVDDDLVIGSERPPHETHSYDGTLVGIDDRGRVYMRDDEALAAYDRGRELVRIAHAFGGTDPDAQAPPTAPRVAATGDRIAVLDGPRVTLYGTDGRERWTADGPAPRDIHWMGDTLVGQFDGALARFDNRGHLAGATCGWDFGLAGTNPMIGLEGGSLCEAP